VVVSGFGRAPDSAGFGRCVSPGPPLFPDIVAAPSTAPISAPPAGSFRCNSAGAPAGDESAARSLSAGNGEISASDPGASAPQHLDFCANV